MFVFAHRSRPYLVAPAQLTHELHNHYFSDGESEEIIARLGELSNGQSIWLGERTLSITKVDAERVARLWAMESIDLDCEARCSGIGRSERCSMDDNELCAEVALRH